LEGDPCHCGGSLRADATIQALSFRAEPNIVAIIVENCFTLLPLKNGDSVADLLATLVTSVTGTFVHLFFILSGFLAGQTR
jgi:hypothetical protein